VITLLEMEMDAVQVAKRKMDIFALAHLEVFQYATLSVAIVKWLLE